MFLPHYQRELLARIRIDLGLASQSIRERENLPLVVWRVEEKRRTYRGGEIGVRGRVIAVLAQLCLQLPKPRRRKLSLSLSLSFLFSYLLSPHFFSFLTFKIEQLSFLFFPFKKVIFFLSSLLSILSFSFLFPSFSTLLSK